MKALLIIGLLFLGQVAVAQETAEQPAKKEAKSKKKKKNDYDLNLRNAVIIGQMDKPEDRYSVEINMTELFNSRGVKSLASLNLMKLGSDSQLLASDSIAEQCKAKGLDTYVLISVRGYDKRFKPSSANEDFATALSRGNLFELYQMDVVSVSVEFKFYRDGQFVYADVVKIGNVSSRDAVLKKLRKKVSKRILKKWK